MRLQYNVSRSRLSGAGIPELLLQYGPMLVPSLIKLVEGIAEGTSKKLSKMIGGSMQGLDVGHSLIGFKTKPKAKAMKGKGFKLPGDTKKKYNSYTTL